MSAHAVNHTFQTRRKGLAAVAVGGAGICLAVMATASPATANEMPEPGRAETSMTVPESGPPNYPTYDPQYEVSPAAEHKSGLDTTSIALGALGGIAFGGAGLGIILGVQRRRDHSGLRPA
jgi:hypothetical protein